MDPRDADLYIEIGAKAVLTIILMLISLTYFSSPRPWTIIDGADLLFHEAGHMVFTFMGEFIMALGGSLLQILIPIGIGLYFLMRKSWYSFLFCVYWLGINLIYVGIYIADAQSMSLPLIHDGSLHDWNYLLSHTGLLDFDKLIGTGVRGVGTMSMVIAEVAMGINISLLIQKRLLE